MDTLQQLKKQLKSFEDACKIKGLKNPKKVVPDFAFFPANDRAAMIEHARMVIIISAANQIANGGKEWIPDYNDDNWKFEPRFAMGGSSGFRFGVCGAWSSHSGVGSRLCFFDEDTMMYVVEKFKKSYKVYFTKKKQRR